MKQSNEIPGQHLLEYYADNAYKKFKGRIDLDDCEQVTVIVATCVRNKQLLYSRLDKLIMLDLFVVTRTRDADCFPGACADTLKSLTAKNCEARIVCNK